VLCSVVMCCIVLCCVVLIVFVLCCVMLVVLHCVVLCCAVLCVGVLQRIAASYLFIAGLFLLGGIVSGRKYLNPSSCSNALKDLVPYWPMWCIALLLPVFWVCVCFSVVISSCNCVLVYVCVVVHV